MEVTIGMYSVPALLMVLLGIIYKLLPAVPDKWKALISIAAGLFIGNLAMLYNVMEITMKIAIDYNLLGLMAGAAAIGLYEGQKTITNPRS